MNRPIIYCIVEGQTENAVLKYLIGGHLANLGIDFHAPIVRTSGGLGGVKSLSIDKLVENMRRLLKDKRLPYVTTFFDYYGFPTSRGKGWDFAGEAKSMVRTRGLDTVVDLIEGEIARRAISGLEVRDADARCRPYIQLHETEALFFAEPALLAQTLERPNLRSRFEKVVIDCGGCERINDSPDTAPSKRIEHAAPNYIKGRSDGAHGPILAKQLNLRIVRNQCPRFGKWLSNLESLANL